MLAVDFLKFKFPGDGAFIIRCCFVVLKIDRDIIINDQLFQNVIQMIKQNCLYI